MEIVWQAEDSLREKKGENDLKDLLKTLVAFANSVAPEDTAKVFIGELDDGSVQGVTDADAIQKRVKKEADKIYPEIYFKTEVYERDGKRCVRVDIRHNGLGPHFGGPAWVRKGSESIRATEELHQEMVELRQNKTRWLTQWQRKNLTITIEGTTKRQLFASVDQVRSYEWSVGEHRATIETVNAHWVTFNIWDAPRYKKSEPMEKLLLCWDDKENSPKVFVINW